MHVFLKIKIKSLAAEASIIRRETNRFTRGDNPVRLELYAHRVFVVRPESRSAGLAYGFLRGRAYEQMETKVHNKAYPDWKRIEALVQKYGEGDPRERMQRFSEWKDKALEHLKVG